MVEHSVLQTMQASPLRIKTIDSRVEPASSAETNAIRLLRREDELKKAMERHRLVSGSESEARNPVL